MNIGIIKNRFVGLGGGSERYTSGLVSNLLQAGHTLHVFAHEWDSSAQMPGVVLHHVTASGAASFARQLSFALACERAVARTPCDLVFSLERTLRQDISRAGGGCHREWLAQRRRYLAAPKRWSLALNPLHWTLLWLERRTFSPDHTRVVIANSHRGKAEIRRHYGYPEDRMFVVHNGVDAQRFQPVARPAGQGEFVMLFVGSGFERKGLEFSVRVLAQLPRNVVLRVAGKGNPAPYLRLARRLGVAERLSFLGGVAKIQEVYAQGHLLLHPAIYEPFSNACLEALASGLPVVTSQINGASEVLTPGQDGAAVADPGNIEELAEAIRPWLDPANWARGSAEARAKALTLPFTRNVEQTLAIIARLTQGS